MMARAESPKVVGNSHKSVDSGRMMAIPVSTTPLTVGPARPLFDDRFVQGSTS